MTRQYGLELIASRKRALRVAKLASRTVRAIVDPPECRKNFAYFLSIIRDRIVPDHGGHHNRKSL
jgi:hypothetical protein